MSTPRVLLPTISCHETITTLGIAVSCEHCYWNAHSSAFVLDTCLNCEKFGNDDDNDNDNGNDVL